MIILNKRLALIAALDFRVHRVQRCVLNAPRVNTRLYQAPLLVSFARLENLQKFPARVSAFYVHLENTIQSLVRFLASTARKGNIRSLLKYLRQSATVAPPVLYQPHRHLRVLLAILVTFHSLRPKHVLNVP